MSAQKRRRFDKNAFNVATLTSLVGGVLCLLKVRLGGTGIRRIGDGQSVCRPADIGRRWALRS